MRRLTPPRMGQAQGKGKEGRPEAPVIDLQNKPLDKFIQEARKGNAWKVRTLSADRFGGSFLCWA